MPELVIRPSFKFLKAAYALAFLAAVAVGVYLASLDNVPAFVPVLPAVLLLWPMTRHIRRHFTKITLESDRLRYETGFTSKVTRTIQLSKVQDVTVNQSLVQRMANVGDLSIETAGEASRLTIRNVDRPRELADEIIAASQKGTQPQHV